MTSVSKLLVARPMSSRQWILCVVLVSFCTISLQKEIKLGLLIPLKTDVSKGGNNYQKGEHFAAAMELAVQDLNANPNILPGHNISYTFENTNCNELLTLRHEFKLIKERISAIIGPGCWCKTAARNAAAFHLPMISYVSITYFLLIHVPFNNVCFLVD